ncbi:no significant database hits [Yersinia enterocolitica]|uniref:darobactin family peptide antibiotic n=1 Tax=Yersinia enterocolitica TaxID=630 RepID=UPI00065A856B|nr:darobactin family peptide antibiotic [Yersinia enterocolitica]CRY18859.1 no significant database hits [Yersinia enterocolitica]
MFTSNQSNERINNTHLMALKTKLESLERSFKDNLFSINDHEIENLTRSNSNNKITAWNWSKSFTQQ